MKIDIRNDDTKVNDTFQKKEEKFFYLKSAYNYL